MGTNLVRNEDHWKVRGLELRHDPQHVRGDGAEESSVFTHTVQLQNARENCGQALCVLHELQHLLFDGGEEKRKNERKKEKKMKKKKRRKFTRKSLTLLVCQVLYSSLEIHKKKLDTFSLPSSLFVSYNASGNSQEKA